MPDIARLQAVFFSTASGAEPVREWLKSLPKQDRRTIGEDIAYVQYKWPIGKPRVDHLRGAIREIRSSLNDRIARTLFAVDGNTMILLDGFVKKTRVTPKSRIDRAEKRFKEYLYGKS